MNIIKRVNKPNAAEVISVALIAIIFVSLHPLSASGQSKSRSQDSTISASATATSGSPEVDPYGIHPRFDPNSSVRKSNPAPKGYLRLPADSVSGFGLWLRGYPMRSDQEPLTTYTGTFIADATVIGGVLDMPITSPMYGARGVLYPLMHEYARIMRRELELNYRGLADDSVSLLRYMTGKYSTDLHRTKYFWEEGEEKPLDGDLLKRYTEFVRNITSYRSLIRDCQEITEADLRPGDLFIQTDSALQPEAHLCVALDVATLDPSVDKSDIATILKDKNGVPYQRIVLYANGLTPASSFHIIRPIKPGKANWTIPGELASKLKYIGPGRFFRLRYRFLR